MPLLSKFIEQLQKDLERVGDTNVVMVIDGDRGQVSSDSVDTEFDGESLLITGNDNRDD